jgi:hypothetical protein
MVVSESWVQSERAKVHNELNRKIARDLLRRTSSRLIEAPDGEAGVTAALEQRPDLVSTYLAKRIVRSPGSA